MTDEDSDVCVIESTTSENDSPLPSSSDHDWEPHDGGFAGSHLHTRPLSSGQGTAVPTKASDVSRRDPEPARVVRRVETATLTETTLSCDAASTLRQHLQQLAASVAPTRGSSGLGELSAPHDRKRARVSPCWEESLSTVKALLLRHQNEQSSGGHTLDTRAEADEGNNSKVELPPPEWESQLKRLAEALVLQAQPSGEEAKGLSHPSAEERPRALHLFPAMVVGDVGTPHRTGGRMREDLSIDAFHAEESAPAASTDASKTSQQQARQESVLSEAEVILSREGSSSLLDLYSELLRFRRQRTEASGSRSAVLHDALRQQQNVYQRLCESLSDRLHGCDVAFREKCTGKMGGAELDGNLLSLRDELESLRALRKDLEQLKRFSPLGPGAPGTHLATSTQTGVPESEYLPPTRGRAFAAMQEALSAERADLHQQIEVAHAELGRARETIATLQRKYALLSSRPVARSDDPTLITIRPEVLQAYRSKCRECVCSLAQLVGYSVNLQDNWEAVLTPAAGGPETTVDLSTGRHIGGPSLRPIPTPQAVNHNQQSANQEQTVSFEPQAGGGPPGHDKTVGVTEEVNDALRRTEEEEVPEARNTSDTGDGIASFEPSEHGDESTHNATDQGVPRTTGDAETPPALQEDASQEHLPIAVEDIAGETHSTEEPLEQTPSRSPSKANSDAQDEGPHESGDGSVGFSNDVTLTDTTATASGLEQS